MMKPIAILAACFLCLCSHADPSLVTVGLSTYTNAASYRISWGPTSTNQPEGFTITGLSSTNLYSFTVIVDSASNCWVTQTTTFADQSKRQQTTGFGPRTNILNTTVWAAPSATGPWTNYTSFNSRVDSNACGFYRTSAHFIR